MGIFLMVMNHSDVEADEVEVDATGCAIEN
jgi:hypothetical protein